MNFCSNKAMREKEKKDFYNLHEIRTNVKGNKTNLKTERLSSLPFKNMQENRCGSLSASLASFWLGYSDLPPNKSQNFSDSEPSFCGLDCVFGCRNFTGKQDH
jgi:hypothetical protein